jgi:membrane protease YdiL (CAAX protease family)
VDLINVASSEKQEVRLRETLALPDQPVSVPLPDRPIFDPGKANNRVILPAHSEETFGKNRLSMPETQEKAVFSPLPQNRFAAELRGFGVSGILAVLVIAAGQIVPPLSAILVLLWTSLSHTPWREIGYVRPKSWIGSLVVGVAFGVLFKFLMKAIVMPLLGANAINPAYHYLVGNRAALPGAVLTMIIVAGFGEETVFRGYLFERLGKLLGRSLAARIATILVSTALFASIHYFVQGLAGAQQAAITGLVFGSVFAVTGRIWTLMCAHAAFDLTAVAIIYWNLESVVAHLIFK